VAELTFVGAAGTVTGSKHLLTVGGRRLFVDCGLFQGTEDVTALNGAPLPVEPDDIEAVVITHGHLDHIGYLPKLVHDGFSGTIYCTPATQALMQIVLDDSAHLQEEMRQRGLEHDQPAAPPSYYDERDVVRTMRLVKTLPLATPFDVLPGVRATYHNAAHVIGSAFITFEIEGKHVVFSGDLGRYGRTLLYDPDPIGPADTIVCESTYADRPHPPASLDALEATLLAGIARGGAMVLPAFAVERTQDILLAIAAIQARQPKVAALPVHLDSPMAEKVDVVFGQFPDAHKPIPHDGASTPFGVRNFSMAVTTDESKQLNHIEGPHLIISASGMASGGRVLHHLHNHVAQASSTIIFVGYQSRGTLGFLLTNGMKTLHLYGDTMPVRAHIIDLAGFSGHADDSDFKRWFATCTGTPHLYAVHGEPASALALAAFVKTELGWPAEAAQRGKTVTI
jgi:metallo-beta-lactamase family protein